MILIFIGCEKPIKSENEIPENLLGDWKFELTKNDSIKLFSTKLELNKNKTFEYYGTNEFKDSIFSHGNWKINNDTIILNSKNIDECFYLWNGISYDCKNFENSNSDNNIVIKQHYEYQTTNKNCQPKSSKIFFAKIENEKILIKNDSLTYIPKKYDCSKYIDGIKMQISK